MYMGTLVGFNTVIEAIEDAAMSSAPESLIIESLQKFSSAKEHNKRLYNGQRTSY